jgi:hypothetical protein
MYSKNFNIKFKIHSEDNFGKDANVNIYKENNKIHLIISRKLFTHIPNQFNKQQCHLEFIQRSKYGAPYSLLKILYVLIHLYTFPYKFHNKRDKKSYNGYIDYLLEISIQNLFDKQNLKIGELELLQEFLDYPINFQKIREDELNEIHIEFIRCTTRILRMKSVLKNENNFQKMHIEEFLYRLQYPVFSDKLKKSTNFLDYLIKYSIFKL